MRHLSLAFRALRQRYPCSPTTLLLSRPHSRCASNHTAINKINPKDDFNNAVIYEPLEGIERLENYQPGGYHPIRIGDMLHGRYKIVHKLGHGAYSTAWLASDKRMNRYVAVKVCTANTNPREVDIMSTLTEPHCSPDNHPGKMMIPSILDSFTAHGPNGNHTCFVTAPASASLSDLKDGSWIRLFQLDVARSLAAQLILAVDYVHSQGIVHGDIHLGNILVKINQDFDKFSLEQIYEKYGEPELEPVRHLDSKPLPPGVPTYGVLPIWLGKPSEEILLSEAKISLSDFGEAFFPSEEQRYISCTPLINRPPETRFEPNNSLSFSSDIWSLACTIWCIVAQRPLFEGFLATEDDMTCEHVDALGILPAEWWERWDARTKKFDEDGKATNRKYLRTWDDRYEDSVQQPRRDKDLSSFDIEEKKAFFDMLRPMFSFRPDDRPTTNQILKSEWMVKWALPEYHRSQDNAKA